jgi:drug/metabolite transporter (DMT)-like permease
MPNLLYLFSFLIYFCFFITDLLIRQSSLKTNTLHFIFYRTTVTILFTLFWVFISGDYLYAPSFNQIAHVALLSGITAFGIIGFTEANKHMAFANILSVNIIGIIFQQLIAFFLLSEVVSIAFIISFVLSIIGLAIHSNLPNNRKGLIWALISSLSWSLGYSLLSVPLKNMEASWGSLIMEVTILLLSFLLIKIFSKNKEIALIKENYSAGILMIGLLTTIGALMVTYTYKNFKVANIGLINIWLFPISIITARYVFSEKISTKEWIGNAFILAGVCYFIFSK